MNIERKNLLKSYKQVNAATARLSRAVSGKAWPLPGSLVDKLLSNGAIVEGMAIEHKTPDRHAPGRLSAMSMCVVRQDLDSLQKFLDAPFLDSAAFAKDVSQAWWFAIGTRSLPAVQVLAARPDIIAVLPAPDALSLFSSALSHDFIQGAELMIDAGMGPGLGSYEISDRTHHQGMFTWCRSAEAVNLLVDRGVSPRPPVGHENTLSDLAQILDRASFSNTAEQSGAVLAVIELIKLGYPLDNVTQGPFDTFVGNLERVSHRMAPAILAPLAPLVSPILPQLSSRHAYTPRGPATLLAAGFDLDLDAVANNWSSWLSGSSDLNKSSLESLLTAGMPGPDPKDWPSLGLLDEYGDETGEIDTEKCLQLIDIGVQLSPGVQEELLASNPELKGRLEAAAAIASSRRLDQRTHQVPRQGTPRRM